MSKPAVIRERTRYKYATEEEAREAKLRQQKEYYLKNKGQNKGQKTAEEKEKHNEYQREWRAKKKLEQQAKDKLLADLLLAQNTANIPITNNNAQDDTLSAQMLVLQISNNQYLGSKSIYHFKNI